MKTDKKISNCCYKNEDCPICPTRTPQEQKSIGAILVRFAAQCSWEFENNGKAYSDDDLNEVKLKLTKLLTEELLKKKRDLIDKDNKLKDNPFAGGIKYTDMYLDGFNHGIDEAITTIERKLSL